ncbi:hypothetical protein HDR67_03190 [bacterium]|nr:hypothetical protein [bacterium]
MKKFIKALCFISVFFILTFVMTSCSGYSFYNDFHGAGADIEKDHIFEVITLEEAKAKKENGDTFVLLYGSSSNVSCVTIVSKLQAQAEYLGNEDAVIYYLNSKDFTTKEKRDEIRSAIGMRDPSTNGDPIIMTFTAAPTSSRRDVDTSDKNLSRTKEFMSNSGAIQYSSLASYIFKEVLAK